MIGRVRVVVATAAVLMAILSGLWWMSPRVEAQAPAPGRVGFVDLQRILAKSQAGVQAREQLEKDKAGMQKQVDNQKADLEKLRDELEKKGQLLSADARRDKQEQLERKVRDARRLVDDLEKELQKKEQGLLAKVLRDVEGVVAKIGKERGYLMIVERRQGGLIYGAAEADVTEEIIKAFDDETRKAKK
ncbi:MAG TPA: OmpH family outer membrane protein [Methylomirabilota bacterium]|jgi:outer membrane protein|nr:OmpH family outer membrane protein [Methylomirabilota bacterium]